VCRDPTRRGFSLIELLVVMAIVAVLIGLTLAAAQRVRAAAARAACGDRLRQLGLAAHGYHGGHGALPPGVSVGDAREPHKFMGWHTRLLPYLEQDALWRQALEAYRLRPDDFRAAPPHPIDVVVPALTCPADPVAQQPRFVRGSWFAFTSYLGVSGTRQTRHDGVLYVDSRTRLTDVTDGASNTLLAGERPPRDDGLFGWWYAGMGQNEDGSADGVLSTGERATSFWVSGCPTTPARFGPGRPDDPCSVLHFWSYHPGGAHFLFCDGAVRFVPYAAADLLPPLATRAGGEPAELP
jgi:prepilin-type N-terminal cleavage/methylation domain-containing protein/prepilin-type processing-associated H-X9-DG protein